MDFFTQQDRVRRRTKWLVIYYVLAVLMTWLAIYALVAVLYAICYSADTTERNAMFTINERGEVVTTSPLAEDGFSFFSEQNFLIFGGSFLLVASIVGGGSWYKISELSAGGDYVAKMMGGEAVNPNTQDPLERRLINVVEEMSIASGIQVPGIFIMRNEDGINAFAAGYTLQDAAVCVTRGTLEYLNRDELQGVIAHEFSHVLNGDMRFNIRLIGILFGLQMIAIIGWFLVRIAPRAAGSGRSRNGKDGGGGGAVLLLLAFGLGLCVIGSVGLFFCSLIRAAISRQREYLADASSVQFTRNPPGIASALIKIGASAYGSRLDNTNALAAAHMCYASPMTSFFANLMASHPPLKDRIKAVDPNFDGKFPAKVEKLQRLGGTVSADETLARQKVMAYEARASKPDYKFPRQGKWMSGAEIDRVVKNAADHATAAAMIASVGQITAGNLAMAASLLDSIPQPAREQVRDTFGAQAVIYALLLDRKPEIRRDQMAFLAKHLDEQTVSRVEKTLDSTDTLDDVLRVPLIEMAFPALRHCGRDDYVKFRGVVEGLVNCDGRIDIFEYTLQAMLIRDLDVHFKLAARLSTQYYAPKGVTQQFTLVLSLLAHAGHDNPVEVGAAFEKASAAFGFGGQLIPKSECTMKNLDASLRVLAHAAMPIKQKLLQAFTICIWADGKVVPRERELLRAIAAMLGCPMPPLEHVVSR